MIITYYLLITIMIGLCISLAISIIQPTKTGMMIIGVVCSLVIATILINDNVKADDKLILIELKRQKPILKSGGRGKPTNDLTPEQADFLQTVNKYKNALGLHAYGCDDAIAQLRKIGINV